MTIPTAPPAATVLDDAGGSADAETAIAPSAPGSDASAPSFVPPVDAGTDAGAHLIVADASGSLSPKDAGALPEDAAVARGDGGDGGDAGDVVDGAVTASDAAATAPPADAGAPLPDGACEGGLAPGSLAIDELMIESVSGTGDYGEWIEVANTAGCMLNLNGLHAETPRGSKVTALDILTDVWLPLGGFFVIADSENPSINHDVPGLVFEWSGGPSDTLRNEGSTVTLSVNGLLIDSVTYPNLKLTPGVSFEFPVACSPTERASFANWAKAASSWFPGFLGTPNAPNSDIACP